MRESKYYQDTLGKKPPIVFTVLWPCTTMACRSIAKWTQHAANRLIQGAYRYGQPQRRQRYLSRMKMEIKAYEVTGNHEHLVNIANYCFLESEAPENDKYHFDNTVESATRKKFGV